MALPFLEIMLSNKATAAEVSKSTPIRSAFMYTPNGFEMDNWTIKENGSNFNLSPTLKPLAEIKNKIGIYSNLDRIKVPGTDGHAQCASCWLSSAKPDELSPAGYPLKRTLDQSMAMKAGKHTPFRSLELSTNQFKDNKESLYFDAISWYGHGHVARSMKNPKQIFKRLFAVQEQKAHKSILDIVMADAKQLENKLGKIDKTKLSEYLDSVRTIEVQIERIEKKQNKLAKMNLKAPVDQAMSRSEYMQLIGDLMILAFKTDLTRVATFMVGPERWDTAYTLDGVWQRAQKHHGLTHNQRKKEAKTALQALDLFHMQQYATICKKMDNIQEANGKSMLDNSMFLIGSGLSKAQDHIQTNLPTVIAGTAGGQIKTGRHIKYPEGTPISNLWLSMANIMGCNLTIHGDSTGELKNFMA